MRSCISFCVSSTLVGCCKATAGKRAASRAMLAMKGRNGLVRSTRASLAWNSMVLPVHAMSAAAIINSRSAIIRSNTMNESFGNIWQQWHSYLVGWTRDRAPKLVVILVLAFIFVRLLGVITRKVVVLAEKNSSRGTLRAQQVRTVAGVVRSAGVFFILFFAFMQVLDAFSFNLAPLLASAGIAGLAIGFGAQTLVKDVINGFFILAENQFEI